MSAGVDDSTDSATRSRSVRAASIVAVAFVAVGLGGQAVATSTSGSPTSVDSTEAVSVVREWAGAWMDVSAEAIGETAEWTKNRPTPKRWGGTG